MITKKSVAIFIFTTVLLVISSSLFAADIEIGANYDNYNSEAKNTFGGSINVSEFLTDEISIKAALENKKNNNYIAYCGAGYEGKIFNFLGGFLFNLTNSKFSPGFILNADVKLFNFISIGANSNFAFSTKNIFENYITNLESYLTFHCKNQDVSLIFDYSHTCIINETEGTANNRDYSLGGYLNVTALDVRSPFKIAVFLGIENFKKTYDSTFSVLDLNVGGNFIFNLEKFGFTVGGESTVYKIGDNQSHIPFAISFSTRFKL